MQSRAINGGTSYWILSVFDTLKLNDVCSSADIITSGSALMISSKEEKFTIILRTFSDEALPVFLANFRPVSFYSLCVTVIVIAYKCWQERRAGIKCIHSSNWYNSKAESLSRYLSQSKPLLSFLSSLHSLLWYPMTFFSLFLSPPWLRHCLKPQLEYCCSYQFYSGRMTVKQKIAKDTNAEQRSNFAQTTWVSSYTSKLVKSL